MMTYDSVSAAIDPIRVRSAAREGEGREEMANKDLGRRGLRRCGRRPAGRQRAGGRLGRHGASRPRTRRVHARGVQLRRAATPRPPAAVRTGKYDQLWQLSMADPHTGLANQLLLLDRLTQALARRRRHGGEVVVCHIDLDNLGEINLDLGYTTGNTVLCEMARRLTSVAARRGHGRAGRRERARRRGHGQRRAGDGDR